MSNNISNTAQSFIVLGLLAICVLVLFFPELSFAGTGGEELNDIYTKTEGMISGKGGKLAALISLIGGVVYSATTGSLKALIAPLGLSIVLGVGPSIVTSGISALI